MKSKVVSLKKGGVRVKRGNLDLLIVEDVSSNGIGVHMQLRPAGRERRALELRITPLSTASVVLHAAS